MASAWEGTLFGEALETIAMDPHKALRHWSRVMEKMRQCTEKGSRPLQVVQHAIIERISAVQAMSLDEAIPMSFFSKELETLSFEGGTRLSPRWISRVRLYKIFVFLLNLRWSSRSAVVVLKLLGCKKQAVSRCSNLRELNLKLCFFLTDRAVHDIFHAVPNLTSISVVGCRRLTDKSLRTFQEQGKQLQHISLGGCYNVTRDGGILPLIRSRFNSNDGAPLRTLDLSGLPLRVEDLEECCRGLPQLERLRIGYMEGMGEDVFLRMVGVHPDAPRAPPGSLVSRLTSLSVHWCSQLTAEALWVLAWQAPRLQELDICGCRRIAESALAHALIIRGAGEASMEDDGDTSLADEGRSGTPFPSLQVLHARFTTLTRGIVDAIKETRPKLQLEHNTS